MSENAINPQRAPTKISRTGERTDGSAPNDVGGHPLTTKLAVANAANPPEQIEADLRKMLARAYIALGDIEKASQVYRVWLAEEPEHPVPLHYLRACTGEPPPPRASDDYVAISFNSYADQFDVSLANLGYCGPVLVSSALANAYAAGHAYGVVADAGCGTGLCGPVLRGGATRLVGVDLAANMLAKAKERGCYDELLEGELTAFFLTRPSEFDTIVAADSLCYFGALEGFARAAYLGLKSGGILIFTVECLDADDGSPYRLRQNGRYAHAGRYVRSCLANAGFEVSDLRRDILRTEDGAPVYCLVVTTRRADP